MNFEPSSPGRTTCYRCFRPLSACLCPVIPRVDNRTQIVVLQHPRERTHPFGTARLVELGLARVEVVVDHVRRVRRNPELLGSLERTALLYPSPRARDVTSLAPHERPERLLVIDGTWHHARTLYRDIPDLEALPHLTLPQHLRSAFQIRRQPGVHCLSTVEAIAFALHALEPETPGIDGLIAAFMAMQAGQLARPRTSGRHRKPARGRETRGIPRALVEGHANLVVAYVESSLDPDAPGGRTLLCCAAERVATGEKFHCVLRQLHVSDAQLEHVGIDRETVSQGASLDQFQAEWARFSRPGDSLAAWNHGTLAVLQRVSHSPPESSVALKGVYLNLKRHRGSLEDIVRQEGLNTPALDFPAATTRAERRLQHAVLLAEFLHGVGCGALQLSAPDADHARQ